MSWFSDLFAAGLGGTGGSDSIGISDLVKAGSSLIGTGADLYGKNAALSQTSKQADALFAYNQQRDLVNDAYREESLKAQMAMAGAAAGATVKAAGIAAAAQNKRTLADLYANEGQELGAQRKDTLTGFANLGDAMASPYKARAGILR